MEPNNQPTGQLNQTSNVTPNVSGTTSMSYILVSALVLSALVISVGGMYYYMNTKTTQTLRVETTVLNSEKASTSNLTSTTTTKTAPIDIPKIIACNPRSYDPAYFSKEKPCVSDMSSTDTERETKALTIVRNAHIENLSSLGGVQLSVSDKQYQLLNENRGPGYGYLIVDILNGKVMDYLVLRGADTVIATDKRLIFSTIDNAGNLYLNQYVYGTEKTKLIPSSKIIAPQTYYYGSSGESGRQLLGVLASSTDSITFGVYDESQVTQKPEIYMTYYKQIGTKVIDLR